MARYIWRVPAMPALPKDVVIATVGKAVERFLDEAAKARTLKPGKRLAGCSPTSARQPWSTELTSRLPPLPLGSKSCPCP